MFTFSVNTYGGLPTEQMYQILSSSDVTDTASVYQQGIGEIYVRMNSDDYRKKPDKDINIKGYLRKKKVFGDIQQSQREVPLITDEEFEAGEKGVTESVASYVATNVTDLLDSLSYKEAMEQYKFYAEKLELECDLVLSDVLLNAKQGCTKCIAKLTELVMKDKEFGEFLKDILQNKRGIFDDNFFLDAAY